MKKTNLIYRGVKPKEFQSISKGGLPIGTVFTTDYFMAKKHGKVIAIPFSKSGLKKGEGNNTFKQLRLKERYFVTTKKRKRFTIIGELK